MNLSYIFIGLFALLVIIQITICINKNSKAEKLLNYIRLVLILVLAIMTFIFNESILLSTYSWIYFSLIVTFLLGIIIEKV